MLIHTLTCVIQILVAALHPAAPCRGACVLAQRQQLPYAKTHAHLRRRSSGRCRSPQTTASPSPARCRTPAAGVRGGMRISRAAGAWFNTRPTARDSVTASCMVPYPCSWSAVHAHGGMCVGREGGRGFVEDQQRRRCPHAPVRAWRVTMCNDAVARWQWKSM